MTILILERVTPSLRGELTRWLIQPKAGVFVGRVSARVRDLLWEKVAKGLRFGSAVLIHSERSEQGFAIRSIGDPSRAIVDFEGLVLARLPVETGRTDTP